MKKKFACSLTTTTLLLTLSANSVGRTEPASSIPIGSPIRIEKSICRVGIPAKDLTTGQKGFVTIGGCLMAHKNNTVFFNNTPIGEADKYRVHSAHQLYGDNYGFITTPNVTITGNAKIAEVEVTHKDIGCRIIPVETCGNVVARNKNFIIVKRDTEKNILLTNPILGDPLYVNNSIVGVVTGVWSDTGVIKADTIVNIEDGLKVVLQ